MTKDAVEPFASVGVGDAAVELAVRVERSARLGLVGGVGQGHQGLLALGILRNWASSWAWESSR